MRLNKPANKQSGVVIIVALFIVALVATMAYLMMDRLSRDTTRTSMITRYVQAEAYAQGSIAWAMDVLQEDWEKQKPNQVIDPMPITSPVNTVNGYAISSTVEDMQGRYNINNLKTDEAQKDFTRLLLNVSPKLSDEDAQSLVHAIVDWITPAMSQNTYSQYYLGLPRPYRPAHRAMISPSELLLVKGMTPAIYAALEPYVTAMSEPTQINVLTASAPVLMTLSPAVSFEAATAIAAATAAAKPATLEAFKALDVVANLNLPDANITISSSYFLVKTDVVIENQHLLIYTLLQRAVNSGKARVSIIWQSIGTW